MAPLINNMTYAKSILSLSLLACIASTPTLTFAQSPSSATLSSEDVAKLRNENAAFLKATAEASPVLNKRLAQQEVRSNKLLEQISDAERGNDTALATKLATQLGEVAEDISRLHAAQLDLRKLNNVSMKVASNLKEDNPSGQVCNGKACGSVPAYEAIVIILTAGLVDELNKKQPFGPNNEIMKGLHAIGDFVQCIFGCK